MGESCCQNFWGSLCSSEDSSNNVISNEPIEADVRFFMVGTGAAGKTTVVRQLKCLCKDNPQLYKAYNPSWGRIEVNDIFSNIENRQFKSRIQQNIIAALYNLSIQTEKWGYPINHPEAIEQIKEIKTQQDLETLQGQNSNKKFDSSLVENFIKLVNDESILKTLNHSYDMSPQYRLEDGTRHFLNENAIKRIFAADTIMTSEDIVHSRYPTTGIQDFRFGIAKLKTQIHDMGGQVSELVKLPQFISQWFVNSHKHNLVLYVTSMADFNLIDETNSNFTVMDRSLKTLSIILDMSYVQECGLLIFLNKQDRFDDVVTNLLKTTEGRQEILKYLGAELSADKQKKVEKGTIVLKELHDAVAKKFRKITKEKRDDKDSRQSIYIRFTQAVDPQIMSTIFKAIECEIMNGYANQLTIN